MAEHELHRALNRLGEGVRRRSYNRRKCFEGVAIPDRTPTSGRDQFSRYSGHSPEQIEAAKRLRDRIVPDD